MAIGILFLITTAIIYIPKFSRQGLMGIELTFLSNFASGILLLWDSLYGMWNKRHLPQGFHLASGCILFFVLLISLLCFGEANFIGAFLFLHIINPLLYVMLIILFTYQCPIKLSFVFLGTLLSATIYFVYVIVYGLYSGDWLYSVINVRDSGIAKVLLFYFIVTLCVPILEYTLYKLSKRLSLS